MVFVSTRGDADLVTSAYAINRGLANDGGLFVPTEFPQVTLEEIAAMKKMSYQERAVFVLKQFLTDYTEEELRDCVSKAYTEENGCFRALAWSYLCFQGYGTAALAPSFAER